MNLMPRLNQAGHQLFSDRPRRSCDKHSHHQLLHRGLPYTPQDKMAAPAVTPPSTPARELGRVVLQEVVNIARNSVRVRVKLGSSSSTTTRTGYRAWAATPPAGCTKCWARRPTLALRFPSIVVRGVATKRHGRAASSPSLPPPDRRSARRGLSRP